MKTAVWVDYGCAGAFHEKDTLNKVTDVFTKKRDSVVVCISYLMVVVDESLPTAILCSPSLICWAQYGWSHATQDT